MSKTCACDECRHCKGRGAKITADPYDSDPGYCYCEEDSENFGTLDGCRYFEELPDSDEEEYYRTMWLELKD